MTSTTPRLHAEATARTSFAVSVAAVAAAVLVLLAVLAALSIGLVAISEPGAMWVALTDGVTYLWNGFVAFCAGLVGA